MKKSVKNIDVTNKRVLVRVDFNVPMEDSSIIDDSRIRATLPTLRYLLERRAKVIVLTHIDRPAGYVVESLRTDPIAMRLADLLGMPVGKVNNTIGPEVQDAVKSMQPGEIIVLENVRFHPGDMVNDTRFAARLASVADLFVNDAFASAHRIHASTVGVARYLPAVAGLLMESELNAINHIRSVMRQPVVALVGGMRLVDKVHFIDDLRKRGNQVLLGGVIANTFFRAKGVEVGMSRVEPEVTGLARALLAEDSGLITLPVDVLVTDDPETGARIRVVPVNRVPPYACIVDIGPETIERYTRVLGTAGTIIWNGPMGGPEHQFRYSKGTYALATRIAGLENTVKIAGGGDTIAALDRIGLSGKMDFLSTGGAAFLDALQNMPLPAVAVLQDQEVQAPSPEPEQSVNPNT